MINCLLLDDEPLALELLETYTKKIAILNLVASCNEPFVAMNYLNNHQIDLLFVDIQMPDIDGINFVMSLPKKPEIIFTSAFEHYAISGFEVNAIDYLLKPFSFERFVTSVNRANELIETKRRGSGNSRNFFFINGSHKIHKITYADIVYLEGLKDYTKIHLTSSPPLLILQTLKYFEESLPKNEFVRIHRSYIVPISRLETITKKTVTICSHTLPVGDNYRDRFLLHL